MGKGLEYLTGFFKEKKNKSGILIILIIGIILLLSGSIFFEGGTGSSPAARDDGSYAETLERKLSHTLSRIRGVSKVEVMITLESKNRVDIAQNLRTKRSGNGGEQYEEEVSAQLKRNSAGEQEIVLSEYYPKIKGVVVVAKGADDFDVKVDIYNAVKAALGVNGNRIEVYESN